MSSTVCHSYIHFFQKIMCKACEVDPLGQLRICRAKSCRECPEDKWRLIEAVTCVQTCNHYTYIHIHILHEEVLFGPLGIYSGLWHDMEWIFTAQ